MARKAGGDRALSKHTLRCYELALRKLDGFLQGAPVTDGSVARHIDGLRRRGASRSSAAAVVSAVAWRFRRQGAPSPCGSLCRAALAAFRNPARAANAVRGRPPSAATVSSYESALRRLDGLLQGASVTDESVARHLNGLRLDGVSRSSAALVVSAVTWRFRRRGASSPCGRLCRAALAAFPKRDKAKAGAGEIAPSTRRGYEMGLRRLAAELRGAEPTDALLAAYVRRLSKRGLSVSTALNAVAAAAWGARRNGWPSPKGPLTAAALDGMPRRSGRAGKSPRELEKAVRGRYEWALRQLDADLRGASLDDGALAGFLRRLLQARAPLGRAILTVSAASWREAAHGRTSPYGMESRAAMRLFRKARREGGIPRRRGGAAAISPATRAQYESVLRHMEAERDGAPMTDAFLAGYVNSLRARGKSTGHLAATAAGWEARRRGLSSPVGPLTKAALQEFRRADSTRARRSGGVSQATQASYESALGRMREAMGAEPATDALLAEYVAKSLGAGKSVASAMLHVNAAVWWAKRNGRGTPKGPLTKAALSGKPKN